jgi:hypothetical protein
MPVLALRAAETVTCDRLVRMCVYMFVCYRPNE